MSGMIAMSERRVYRAPSALNRTIRPKLNLPDNGPSEARLFEAREIARSAEVKPTPELTAWTVSLLAAIDAWQRPKFHSKSDPDLCPRAAEANAAVLGVSAHRDPELLRFAHGIVAARDEWSQTRMQRKGRH